MGFLGLVAVDPCSRSPGVGGLLPTWTLFCFAVMKYVVNIHNDKAVGWCSLFLGGNLRLELAGSLSPSCAQLTTRIVGYVHKSSENSI